VYIVCCVAVINTAFSIVNPGPGSPQDRRYNISTVFNHFVHCVVTLYCTLCCDVVKLSIIMSSKCLCIHHDQYADNQEFKVYSIHAKKHRKPLIRALIDSNALSSSSTSVCTACIAYAESHLRLANHVHQSDHVQMGCMIMILARA
jgi:hypothetical protein